MLTLLASAACDRSTDPAGGDIGADAGSDAGAAGLGNDSVPACPFTAAQVSDLLGQPMKDEGNCLFGDGKGVASLTITMASQTAGAMTYDYQHDQAGQRFDRVVDLDQGDRAYVAAKDIEGEAVVVSPKGSYTVTMSSFSVDTGTYERKLRALLDAILA
ncbi:hypothetical protein [Micromonospora sp. SL4-19]|uniref:hypothetical protein n=1 Tax=Micromonospora sp. SL4-19 TaxID=3399129 RepID=UPI003A4E19E3